MLELKPCPCCGQKPFLFDSGTYWKETYYRIICNSHCVMQGKFYNTPEEAAKNWNIRICEDDKNV